MRRFARLFAGRASAYGKYIFDDKELREDGKKKGRGVTIHAPLTDEVYENHLVGVLRLGVVPIREDDTVSWFAGDIDTYPVNLLEIETKAQAAGFPLVVCRSKSGGAHLFCFVRGNIPAKLAISLMKSWVAALGYPKAEVFPKQAESDEDTVGNWINLPYHIAEAPDAYAIGLTGEALTLPEFEQLANARAAKPEELEAMAKATGKKPGKDPKKQAPPCVERMWDEGIGSLRNNSLTQVAIYLHKSDPDHWKDKLHEWNYRRVEEPLPSEELGQIIKNISKGKYEYMCTTEPMCSLCDRNACLGRKWGVGPGRGTDIAEEIERIEKVLTDPPIYHVFIFGQDVTMTTEQLMKPEHFRQRVFEVTHKFPAPILKKRHHEERLAAIEQVLIEAPPEVSLDGQITEAFDLWVEGSIADRFEAVRDKRCFYDEEARQLIFQSAAFMESYTEKYPKNETRRVWDVLRMKGCYPKTIKIDKKATKCWIMPVEELWFDYKMREKV